MGQVLDGSATTTEAVRRAIQHSQASLRELARRYGVNPKTIAKWRKRTSVADGTAAAALLHPFGSGGGHRRGLPSPHRAAAR